ncbi:MAG: HAD family hydrolase [Candidatus Woesearchaeota archaeon]
MTKLIIFDVWGTLIETGVRPSPSKQVKYFLRDRRDFSEFVLHFEEVFLTKEYESLKQGFEEVVNEFGLRIPDFVYDKLIGMWNKNAILAKEYEDTFEVLEDLKKEGYKLALLANIDKFSWEQLKQKFELDKYFDKVFLSFETGKLKHNETAYKDILKAFKVKSDDAVMIGDGIESDMESSAKSDIKGILIDRRDSREFQNKITSLKEIKENL